MRAHLPQVPEIPQSLGKWTRVEGPEFIIITLFTQETKNEVDSI